MQQPISKKVNNHMRRVLVVFAVFVAVNIAVLSRFFLSNKPGKLSPLFPYVSSQAQQAVLVQSDSILKLLGDDVAAASSNPLYATLAQSNNI